METEIKKDESIPPIIIILLALVVGFAGGMIGSSFNKQEMVRHESYNGAEGRRDVISIKCDEEWWQIMDRTIRP